MEAGPSKSLNRARTVLDLHRDPKNNLNDKDFLATIDLRLCPKCRKPAAGKKGGFVIACGESFFHVDCYKCKKCQIGIEIDDNILLDFDNLPLCEDCFHSCSVCQLTITGNPMYVGTEGTPYHVECFKCKKCKKSLEGQKFARGRTSTYCEECHKMRAGKIRRHLKKREERGKLAYGGIASPTPLQ